jgi:ABC-type uncharacterized transport system substrate-binding protein
VVILKSSDLVAYDLVAAAVESTGQRDVKIITLADDSRAYDRATKATWSAKPDVIVAVGIRALDIACRDFTNTPVVFGMVADTYRYTDRPDMIAGVGLIPSSSQVLRAIRAVLPRTARVAVVFDAQRSPDEIEEFIKTGKRLGVKVDPVRFSKDVDVEGALRSVAGPGSCLVVYPDAVLLSDKVFANVVSRAFSLGMPAIAYSSAFAHKGALMSVEADYASVGKDMSQMTEQILSGVSPRTLGIHAPSRVKVTVNKAVADELGIQPNVAPGTLPAEVVPPVELIATTPRPR